MRSSQASQKLGTTRKKILTKWTWEARKETKGGERKETKGEGRGGTNRQTNSLASDFSREQTFPLMVVISSGLISLSLTGPYLELVMGPCSQLEYCLWLHTSAS